MGKNKKGFNWKARQVVDTVTDNSETKKINLDLPDVRTNNYDHCNALVLPSKKRKSKKIKDPGTVTKLLSKKQRKLLEKIVDKKKKKESRSNLLESLSKVQASSEELEQLTSISTVQTMGLRQFRLDDQMVNKAKKRRNECGTENVDINCIKGSKKRKRLIALGLWGANEQKESDPNIVGFEESSSNDDDEDDDDGGVDGKEDEKPIEVDGSENSAEEMNLASNKVDQLEPDSKQTNGDVESCQNSLTASSVESIVKPISNISSNCTSTQKLKTKVKLSVTDAKPAVFVPVHRKSDIQAARLKLPILAEEQVIMEAIKENPVLVLAGETGSGKTTQVPQFLYESGFSCDGKLIGITEPRRVAAISMARRVGEEMNLSSKEVSYLIRFEGNVTDETQIKFMTDGVLLKEIQNDFLLKKYSVVIIDEAHERSVYTDILIGLLSRIVPLREKRGIPLKLIIMSATLRIEDFTDNIRLFKTPPPVIKVESRQFPVTIHYNKRTKPNYVAEAFNKTYKIHTQLPEGGILIFVTGQQEVNYLVRKLRKAFPLHKPGQKFMPDKNENDEEEKTKEEEEIENELDDCIKRIKSKKKANNKITILPQINLEEYSVDPKDDTEGDLIHDEDLDEDVEEEDEDNSDRGIQYGKPLWVLPLYSLLSSNKQAKVFKPPPPECRLCVVATNVAETSLTIPNIKYVVDTGKSKTRLYDKITGVSAFTVTWTSKASANQRAGRAGRMGPGHCYRLYSSAVFNDEFEQFAIPEIQRKPVDDLMLQMKVMNIDKVANFPFPSAPDGLQFRAAENRLQTLGILDDNGKVTALGKAASAFSVAPRFGKILALSHQQGLLPYAIALVAALSVQEVLSEAPDTEGEVNSKGRWAQLRRSWAGTGNSLLLGDPMVLLKAIGAAEYAGFKGELEKFCQEKGLRHKAVVEIRKLRLQLTREFNLALPEVDLCVDPMMPPPTDAQALCLRQLLLSGMPDQVAHKVDSEEIKETEDKLKWKRAYRCAEMEDPVTMHWDCVLRKQLPEWVVYQEVFETNKMYMRGVTAIEPQWLPIFAPTLCNLSPPLSDPPPRYDYVSGKMYCHVTGSFGRAGWALPVVEIEFPENVDRYKWFACFLLDGSVCPKLKQFVPSLMSPPSTMTKTWANLQPRTNMLFKALLAREVYSRDRLLEVWKDDGNYLKEAYCKWLPESAHNEVALYWPPLERKD